MNNLIQLLRGFLPYKNNTISNITGELIEDSANALGSKKSSPMAKAIAIKILLHFARDNIDVLLKQPALKSYLEQMPLEDLLLPESDNRE